MKRYQVFVSSTYDDLIEERSEVSRAILESDCIPAGMELFPASDNRPWEIIKKVIAESDIYLVVVAGRYGSCEKGYEHSYTEREFDYARRLKKPIIAMLYGTPQNLPVCKTEQNDAERKALAKFRKKLEKGRERKLWNNKDELRANVLQALHAKMQDADFQKRATGWIKGEEANIVFESPALQRTIVKSFTESTLKASKQQLSDGEKGAFLQYAEQLTTEVRSYYHKVYYEQFHRNVIVTLYDDKIHVRTSDFRVYSNPAGEPLVLKLTPIFRRNNPDEAKDNSSLEYETFRFTQLYINRESAKIAEYYCEMPPKQSRSNSDFVYGKRMQINLQGFGSRVEIRYDTEYDTAYNMFEQAISIPYMCSRMGLEIQLCDERSKKVPEYRLRFCLFSSAKKEENIMPKMVVEKERVSLPSIEWVPANTGYTVTLWERAALQKLSPGLLAR